MWNAAEYLKFAEERARPFKDMMSRLDGLEPAIIADLGCGAGNLTRIIADRWPRARVIGVDHSTEMLAAAEKFHIPGRLDFIVADIATWTPARPLDLVISNAALQWIGDHAGQLARFRDMLAPGGALAVQLPHGFQDASHRLIEETAADPRWVDRLHGIGLHRESVMPLAWYVQRLLDLGMTVDAWETTYVHLFRDHDPVLDWLRGTALRPILARLDAAEAGAFLGELGERLRAAYPTRGEVTPFPMPRLFFVARRG